MAISNLIDKIVPTRLRHQVGCFVFSHIVSKSKILLYPYLYILTGRIPKGIKFLPNKECSAYGITATWEGIWTFIEIFQDEIYEKMGSPEEGDIVLDIGAYVGMFAIKASKQVRRKGVVVAIEPETINFNYLTKNCSKYNNIKLVKKVVSSKDEKTKLYISKGSALHSLTPYSDNYIKVESTTIDSLVTHMKLPKVDFIKIDAEGAELEILQGAENTLSNNRLKLAIAAYHDLPNGKKELPELITFLKERGFLVYTKGGYIYAKRDIQAI